MGAREAKILRNEYYQLFCVILCILQSISVIRFVTMCVCIRPQHVYDSRISYVSQVNLMPEIENN